jgi:hypothetical protein
MRARLAAAGVAGALALCASAQGAIWHGTKADGAALTRAIERTRQFGCYRPVGAERLTGIRVSNNQRERGIDFVALASQAPPRNAQGCEVIFEHRRGGSWTVLSYGTSPCDSSTPSPTRAACRALFPGLAGARNRR